jgi:hypothetical protein
VIFSSSDIERLIGDDPIIKAICDIEIVDAKPALKAGSGVVIYIKRYPELSEFEARWDIWIIDYDNEPVDVVIRQLRKLLPRFTLIEEGVIIKASTTELRSERTETEIKIEPVAVTEDPYEEKFQDLLQSIEDRMLLVGPGRSGRDGRDGKDGINGKDGIDGKDLEVTEVELGDLNDVFISDANRGQFLMFDGAGWIPRFVPQVFSGGGGGSSEGGGGDGTMPEPPDDGRFYLRQVNNGAGQWVDLLTALNALYLDGGDFDGRRVKTSTGNYVVTGYSSSRYIIKTLPADRGTFIASGENGSFLFDRILKADSVDLIVAGSPATISASRIVTADAASFTVTGQSGDDIIGYRILGAVGNIDLTGSDGQIRYNEPDVQFYGDWAAQNYGYLSEVYPDGWAG